MPDISMLFNDAFPENIVVIFSALEKSSMEKSADVKLGQSARKPLKSFTSDVSKPLRSTVSSAAE